MRNIVKQCLVQYFKILAKIIILGLQDAKPYYLSVGEHLVGRKGIYIYVL